MQLFSTQILYMNNEYITEYCTMYTHIIDMYTYLFILYTYFCKLIAMHSVLK